MFSDSERVKSMQPVWKKVGLKGDLLFYVKEKCLTGKLKHEGKKWHQSEQWDGLDLGVSS